MGRSTIGALALAMVLTLPAATPALAQDVPETAAAPAEAPAAPVAEVGTTAAAPAPAAAPRKKASFAEKAAAIVGGAGAGFAAFKLIQGALKKKDTPAETPQQ